MFKVFIVDDEQIVIDGLRECIDWESLNLELAGCATSGEDVLPEIAQKQIHLIITDICMPGMNGLELITLAKERNPSLRFIIISAYNDFDYVRKALQLGVENYLLKPINNRELQDTLRKTVENLESDQSVISRKTMDIAAFRTNILDRWVNGTIEEFELRERAALIGLDLNAAEYAVCVIGLSDAVPAEKRIDAASMLPDICRRTVLSLFKGEVYIDSSFRVIIILNCKCFADMKAELAAKLECAVSEAKRFGINIFASVGGISANPASINTSRETALYNQAYRYLDPSAALYIPDDFYKLQPDPDNGISASSQTFMQFFKALKDEDRKQAVQHARKLTGTCDVYSVDELKHQVASCSLALINAVIHSGRMGEALPESLTCLYSRFAELASHDEIGDWLVKAVEDSFHVMCERKVALHLLVRMTLDSIAKSYASDITLKTLAVSLNVSPVYLGQLFRKETGRLFNDYLTDVRLQESKILLQETCMRINDIILRVGIPHQSYFNLIFKKKYGFSPNEFRRQMQKKQVR